MARRVQCADKSAGYAASVRQTAKCNNAYAHRHIGIMKSLVRNDFAAITCEAEGTLRGLCAPHVRVLIWRAMLDCGIRPIQVPGLVDALFATTNAYAKKIRQNNLRLNTANVMCKLLLRTGAV